MKIWRTEEVAWRRIDRETVVVHLTRHWMYALNESGGQLWEMLAEPLEGDRLTVLLNQPAVTTFLTELVDEGLVASDGPLPETLAIPHAGDDSAFPRIEWREEVRRFAGQCALLPGGGDLCFAQPENS
jgi:hypothetical protein